MTDTGRETSAGLLRTAGARNAARIREILDVRLMLEPQIAELAAAKAGPADIARLTDILAEQKAALQSGKTPAGADAHFHLSLARITQNEALCEVAALLYDLWSESREAPLQTPSRRQASLDGHKAIVAALATGDAKACGELMRDHLLRVSAELPGEGGQGVVG